MTGDRSWDTEGAVRSGKNSGGSEDTMRTKPRRTDNVLGKRDTGGK